MLTVGLIDIELYQKIADSKIITNEVIITEDRIQHIIQRRGKAFYDEYHEYFADILADPDYIFKDERDNTALVCKTIQEKGNSVNLVLRLAVEGENPAYKNSIITAIKENNKRFTQRLRNNQPVYQKLTLENICDII